MPIRPTGGRKRNGHSWAPHAGQYDAAQGWLSAADVSRLWSIPAPLAGVSTVRLNLVSSVCQSAASRSSSTTTVPGFGTNGIRFHPNSVASSRGISSSTPRGHLGIEVEPRGTTAEVGSRTGLALGADTWPQDCHSLCE
jgi:hypothetical protein